MNIEELELYAKKALSDLVDKFDKQNEGKGSNSKDSVALFTMRSHPTEDVTIVNASMSESDLYTMMSAFLTQNPRYIKVVKQAVKSTEIILLSKELEELKEESK